MSNAIHNLKMRLEDANKAFKTGEAILGYSIIVEVLVGCSDLLERQEREMQTLKAMFKGKS